MRMQCICAVMQIMFDSFRDVVGGKMQSNFRSCNGKLFSFLGFTIGRLEKDTPVKNRGYASDVSSVSNLRCESINL